MKAHAPYNKIIVTAAAKNVPLKLLEQLSNNGIMVIPLGQDNQFLTSIPTNKAGRLSKRVILPVRFVPFT